MKNKLKNHIIVVGYGRVGRATVEAAQRSGTMCAVVEKDPAMADDIEADGATPVIGDAREPETLEEANIAGAVSLVSALSDPENLVVVSTARMMRSDIRLVARVADMEWCARLRRAGADDLVPVYRSAGQHLALSATTAGVLGVMDEVGGFTVEEIEIGSTSKMLGLTPQQIMERHPHVVIVGIRRENDLTRWHEVRDPIAVGDVVIVVGPAGTGQELS